MSGPIGGWRRPVSGGASHNDPVGSWSLDVMMLINGVGQTCFFGRSHGRAGDGTGHMRRWHRRTVCPEFIVRQG